MAERPGERGRAQHRAPELLGEALEPADQVDRRAEHGEVEPVGAADVAIDDLADVQRRGEGERQGVRGRAGERVLGALDRLQRRPAGGRAVAAGRHREDREHAVAQELEHVAALGVHAFDDRLEIAVERAEQRRLREALAEAR